MTIHHRRFLVLLVSVGQLVCLVLALVWFVSWLETSLLDDMRQQVLLHNQLVATQTATLIRNMGITDPIYGSVDWQRLQDLVESTRLPNDGFLGAIERHSGQLLCHPDLRDDPSLRSMTPGQVTLEGADTSQRIVDLINPTDTPVSGGAQMPDGSHLIGLIDMPDLGIKVMAHQREKGIRTVVGRVVSVVNTIGISTAFVLAGFTTLVTIGIVRKYENRLSHINTRLMRANDRMSRDLAAAARVQQSLLPKVAPVFTGVRVEWALNPCDELAGDILNVFQLDEQHLCLYVLDVSGHGVAASLLSTTLHRELAPVPNATSVLKRHLEGSTYALRSPAEVAAQLNEQYQVDTSTLQYFTLLYGILHLSTREFRFASAGHPGPVHLSRANGASVLEDPSYPIGFVEEADYVEHSVQMMTGDRLYLYSDGITEAQNVHDQQFGQDQLVGAILEGRSRTLSSSLSLLLQNVESWCGHGRHKDDMTVLAMEMT